MPSLAAGTPNFALSAAMRMSAARGQLASAAHAVPLDLAYRRGRERLYGVDGCVEGGLVGPGLFGVRAVRVEVLDVGACRECLVAATRQDDDARLFILRKRPRNPAEPQPAVVADGVTALGCVDDYGCDTAAPLQTYAVGHGSSRESWDVKMLS